MRANQLVTEIKEICGQYLEEVGSGGYRVWPKSIRDKALLLCDLIGSTKKAAEHCGLSAETIYQWRAEVKKSQFKSLAVVEPTRKSVTVTDTNSKKVFASSVSITVTTPKGFIIGGLDIEHEFLCTPDESDHGSGACVFIFWQESKAPKDLVLRRQWAYFDSQAN